MIQTKLLRGLCQMSRTKWDTLSTEIGSKEISSIIKQNKNEIGKTMSEITSQMTKPSLLFSVNKSEKKVANLIVKDGKEILSQTSFRLIKGEDIIRMLPQGQKGSIIKSFINTNKAKRLITEKMNLQELLKQFGLDIRRIKKPTIEMATKSNERFEIVHLTLKDGDNILLKGAYSKSFGIDDRIKSIEKYHFTGVKNRETGYSVNKTVGYSDTDGRNINFELQGFFNRGGNLDIMSPYNKDYNMIFGFFSSRTPQILKNLSNGKSYNEIAKEMKILTEQYTAKGYVLRDVPDCERIANAEKYAMQAIDKNKNDYKCNTLDELTEAIKKDIQDS